MPKISTLSNPTGLIELKKHRVGVMLDEQRGISTYSLSKLDLEELALPHRLDVIVLARRANFEVRTSHGPVGDWNKGFIDISELGTEGSLSFRVLLVEPGSPKLIAAAENIRPNGLGDSESFIGLEPADLGQVPWELLVLESEGRAVIRFNRHIYSSPAVAESNTQFCCLVFPEALRRLGAWHLVHVGAFADEHWQPFKSWLLLHGVSDEPAEGWDPEQGDKWCRSIVNVFCSRIGVADQLKLVSISRSEA